jgi:histidine ammonia-lyase
LEHAKLGLALSLQALNGVGAAFDEDLQQLRPHPNIMGESESVLKLLQGSLLLRRRRGHRSKRDELDIRDADVQDDYSLRCATVAYGAARNAIEHARQVVEIELNSVTDNPIILFGKERTATVSEDGPEVVSGGHFHGAILALPADYLRCAISEIASVSERRCAKLLDNCRNSGLPKYLIAPNDENSTTPPGLRSGWMISQYSAASMVNALKTACMPYSVDSIPTGNNSEDYVSMGSNAAKATYDSVDTAYAVVAIELLVACRALLLREKQLAEGRTLETLMSSATYAPFAKLVEECSLQINEDRELAPLIRKTVRLMRDEAVLSSRDK